MRFQGPLMSKANIEHIGDVYRLRGPLQGTEGFYRDIAGFRAQALRSRVKGVGLRGILRYMVM